jgi:VIT1/CCC1 family predicted Fe2+/Mn2+ transporter
MRHSERHRRERIGWLRAAVLGADDGIVFTANLIVGVAAAGSARDTILLAGLAGLVAGAVSSRSQIFGLVFWGRIRDGGCGCHREAFRG